MTTRTTFTAIILTLFASICFGDTFKNRQDGKTFDGFVTQKQSREKTLIYNVEKKKFTPVDLSEYEVEQNSKGRRDSVIVFTIRQGEVMLSKSVSGEVAKSIVTASNNGPLFILLDIDSPGGKGEYMKLIADAVAETDNCPIVAYVGGGSFGGAYSASTVLAMACDKIYISSNAVLGSVAPMAGLSGSIDTDLSLRTYSSESLAPYAGYIAALAEKHNRPGALAKGLIDRNIEIAEVKDVAGVSSFIDKEDRKSTETIIRTWTKRQNARSSATTDQGGTGAGYYALTLTASEAVTTGLADKMVDSINEIFADMNSSNAKTLRPRNTEKAIVKFNGIKRNVSKSLTNIDILREQVTTLQDRIKTVETQLLTGTATVRQGTRSSSDFYNRRSNNNNLNNNLNNRSRSRQDRRNRQNNYMPNQSITTQVPVMSVPQLSYQLNLVLGDLTREYKRLIAVVRRDPGTLPLDITRQTLEEELRAAEALSSTSRRRATGTTRY